MANLVTPPLETKTAQNSLSLVYRDSQQTLPQKLFQPLNVAIILSAVLHGVIGYGAPALPFFQRPAVPREVKIMQLTPQEQSRIRRDVQPLPPAVTGVPIPNAPGQGRTVSPGFPGTFPNNSNNFSTVPRGSNFPTYVPDDGTTFVPNPRYGTFGGGATQYRVPSDPETEPRQIVVAPRETPAPNIPARRSDQFRTADNFTTAGRSVFSSPFTRPSPTTTSTPTTPTPTATSTPTSTPTGGNPENTSGTATSNPTPTPTPTASTASTEGNGSDLGGNSNTGNTNNGNLGGTTPNPFLAFNPERTELTSDSQDAGFIGFLGAGNEQFLQPDKQVKLTLEVKYPPEACVLKLDKPVTAIFGVIIDEAGTIAKGPEMIQSSGYGIFNEAAQAATIAYGQFTPAKVYIVTVPFVYSPDACAGVSNLPASPQGTALSTP